LYESEAFDQRRAAMPQITLFIQPGFQMPGKPRCFSGSPFAIKVQRLLQYKNLPFRVQEVGWIERPEVLPIISRSRKLPVLEYDGEKIEDSTAIAHVLEARHPEPRLLPLDELLAARCYFLEEWADEALYWYGIYEQCRMTGAEYVYSAYYVGLPDEFRTSSTRRAIQSVEENLDRQGVGRYPPEKVQLDVRRGLDALVSFLRRDEYLTGNTPTLADIAVFAQLHRRSAGTNPWLEAQLTARPELKTWMRRVDIVTGASTALERHPSQAQPGG
jgi:glutathione S-transferase